MLLVYLCSQGKTRRFFFVAKKENLEEVRDEKRKKKGSFRTSEKKRRTPYTGKSLYESNVVFQKVLHKAMSSNRLLLKIVTVTHRDTRCAYHQVLKLLLYYGGSEECEVRNDEGMTQGGRGKGKGKGERVPKPP